MKTKQVDYYRLSLLRWCVRTNVCVFILNIFLRDFMVHWIVEKIKFTSTLSRIFFSSVFFFFQKFPRNVSGSEAILVCITHACIHQLALNAVLNKREMKRAKITIVENTKSNSDFQSIQESRHFAICAYNADAFIHSY